MLSLPTKPQRIRELLQTCFATWRCNFLPTLPLAIILASIVAFLSYFIAKPLPSPFSLASNLQFLVPSILISSLFIFILYAAIYNLTHTLIHHRSGTIFSSVVVGLKRLFPIIFGLIVLILLMTIITLIISTPIFIIMGVIAEHYHTESTTAAIAMHSQLFLLIDLSIMIIPYIIFTVLLIFYFPLIVVERLSPISAFSRSCKLTWGHWWRTALVTGILYMVVPTLLVSLAWFISYNLAAHFISLPHMILLHSILQGLISGLYIPFYCAVILVQMHDLMIRKMLPH